MMADMEQERAGCGNASGFIVLELFGNWAKKRPHSEERGLKQTG
jgi:hypothetical protein